MAPTPPQDPDLEKETTSNETAPRAPDHWDNLLQVDSDEEGHWEQF